jgi:uncharacterized protein (DUF305 family)
MKIGKLACGILATALLSACSGQGEEQQAGANEGTQSGAAMDNSMAGGALHSQGPFAEAEGRMHRTMMAAVGVDPADTWVRKMIEHHQGAVDMSREVLKLEPTPDVKRLAETTIDRQGKEIEQLRGLVREGAPDPASARLYMSADAEMMQGMMAATGADASEAWIRKMIAHHRGALTMSDVVLQQNPPADIRRLAEQTKIDQGREIAELEQMLQGRTTA